MKPEMIVNIVTTIKNNKSYLSELDGVAGDGDHGLNMDKGLSLGLSRVSEEHDNSEAFRILADTVIVDIGGSMGPLYGTLFYALSDHFADKNENPTSLLNALDQSISEIEEFGARENDKTLLDVLYPCKRHLEKTINEGLQDKDILETLSNVALQAAENTKELEAKVGRAARLGERSIGHIDAGSMSCGLIISEISKSLMVI